MKTKSTIMLSAFASLSMAGIAQERPNIVVLLTDDISAREYPIYGSDVWTKPGGGNTQNPKYRAYTPVMESLVDQSCVISTCWSATVSSPTRAQLMTGRYAHLHKWWHNGDFGRYKNDKGQQEAWPLYESSPYMIGKIAQMGGYGTCWAGKTQMDHTDTNIANYGFDEGFYTPGDRSPLTDFKMIKTDKPRDFIVEDSGILVENTYNQTSYFWMPSVMVVNTPDNTERDKMQAWPISEEDKASYGLNSFSADLEQDYIFDFMERTHEKGKPFFAYHTTHLGHDHYNYLHPELYKQMWVETPKVEWTGSKYIRTEPNITGDKGVYDDHGSITEVGMYNHVNYIDYVIWRYLEKFKEMGIEDNTIFIILADNGTWSYGKGNPDRQKGIHVPFIIHAPCLDMTKLGHQKALANVADILPTVAEVAGVELPADYEICGESLIPFVTSNKPTHRDWIYSYKNESQFVRGDYVMHDGNGIWYDVTGTPSDLISFPKITDWSKVSAEHRAEKAELEKVLDRYDMYESEHDGPGGIRVQRKK